MDTYLEIGRVNLKHNLSGHIVLAVLFSLLAPLVIGIKGLDASRCAQVLETYLQLVGIILLVPVFMPEQDKNIRDVTDSKYIPARKVYLVRTVESMAVLTVVLGVFVMVLHRLNPVFDPVQYYLGTMAGAVFLGGLGIFSYSLTNQLVIAYMIPMVYYALNYSGNKYLKDFYLFSMMMGQFGEKIVLGVSGVLLAAAGIYLRRIHR